MSIWIEARNDRYIVRWRENGRKHGKTFTDEASARLFRNDLETKQLTGTYVPVQVRKRPFGEYATELLEADMRLEASSRYNLQKALAKWIGPGLGEVPIGDIDQARLRLFFAWMRAQGATEHTVGRIRAHLTKYFRAAVQEGILTRNPLDGIRAPKTPRREIRVLTPEEVQAIADASEAPWRMVPLLSAWGTFRIGEVAALREDSIAGDRITVRQAVGHVGSVGYLKEPKSAASRRTITLPAWVMAELREHILAHRHEDGLLFRAPKGGLLTSVNYHGIWRKALRAAQFSEPWPRPHDLRHTAISIMIASGADPKKIQQRCGHATITETFDTYGHLFPGHDEALIAALEARRPREAQVIEMGG